MKIPRQQIVIFSVTVCYLLVTGLLNITCPILYLTGYRCPTCGMGRALKALLQLDFKLYARYNFFALPVLVAAILLVNLQAFKHKKVLFTACIAVLVLNFLYYIARFFVI